MTPGDELCDRCGHPADHLFPDPRSGARICSRCYEALKLHQQGVVLNKVGLVAIVLGAGLLIAIAILLLAY